MQEKNHNIRKGKPEPVFDKHFVSELSFRFPISKYGFLYWLKCVLTGQLCADRSGTPVIWPLAVAVCTPTHAPNPPTRTFVLLIRFLPCYVQIL